MRDLHSPAREISLREKFNASKHSQAQDQANTLTLMAYVSFFIRKIASFSRLVNPSLRGKK